MSEPKRIPSPFTPIAAASKAGLAAGALALGNETKGALVESGENGAAPPQPPSYRPIAVMEVSGAERDAALKMPRKQAAREAAQALQQQLDEQLAIAIRAQLRIPDDEPVAPHLAGHRFESVSIVGTEGETFLLDGVALLAVGPVEIFDDGELFRAQRRIVRLGGNG